MSHRKFEITRPETLKRLSAFLAPRRGKNISTSIHAIRWEDGQAAVEFSTPSNGPLRILIEPRKDKKPFFIQTKHLNISYEGTTIKPQSVKIIEAFAALLRDETLDGLVNRFRNEPHNAVRSAVGAPEQSGAGGEEAFEARSAAALWGSALLGDQFLAENTRQGSEVQVTCDSVIVAHGEFECFFVQADLPHYRSLRFIESFWPATPYPPMRRGSGPGAGSVRRPAIYALCTDMNESEAILGDRKKLGDVLGIAAGDSRFKLCYFNATCVPTITGEDIQGPISTYRSRCDKPILVLTESGESQLLNVADILKERAARPGFHSSRKRPNTVNLVGYADENTPGDLRDELLELGIHINVDIFPSFDPAHIDRYMKAKIQVLRPDAFFRDIYGAFFDDLPMTTLKIDAPYGPRRTFGWLKTIAGALGREDRFEAAWRTWWSPLEEKWESMQREAAQCTLAFILSPAQLKRFMDPRLTHSIPVTHAVDEMRFNTALLIGAGEQDPVAVVEKAKRRFTDAGLRPPVFIRPFRDIGQLRDLLEKEEIDAAYSEFPFDRRLTKAGLNRFSCKSFDMGLSGAVRTLEHLLRTCRMPFYRRYKKYFIHTSESHGS